jgi:hypothetical protein
MKLENLGLGLMLIGSFGLGCGVTLSAVGLWLKYTTKYQLIKKD